MNTSKMTQDEVLLSLVNHTHNLESVLESLKRRQKSNDEMVWEMFSAIIDKLNKENIMVSLPVKAKYDVAQTKLDNNVEFW